MVMARSPHRQDCWFLRFPVMNLSHRPGAATRRPGPVSRLDQSTLKSLTYEDVVSHVTVMGFSRCGFWRRPGLTSKCYGSFRERNLERIEETASCAISIHSSFLTLRVRLYWMWRNSSDYSPSLEFGSYAGQLEIRHGVK